MNITAYLTGYLTKVAETTQVEQDAATIAMPSAATTTHHLQQDPYGSPGDPTMNEIQKDKKDAPEIEAAKPHRSLA
jgi:hypothetical protein